MLLCLDAMPHLVLDQHIKICVSGNTQRLQVCVAQGSCKNKNQDKTPDSGKITGEN